MLLIELLVTNLCGCPAVVEEVAVEVVVVVACSRYNVCVAVGDAYNVITELHHLSWVGISVVPLVHEYVVNLYRGVAFCVCECAPNASLLAILLGLADAVVGEVAELLHNGCVAVRVLVGTYVEAWATEHRLLATKVLHEE